MSTTTNTENKFSLQVNTDFDVKKLEKKQKVSKIKIKRHLMSKTLNPKIVRKIQKKNSHNLDINSSNFDCCSFW